MSAPCVVKMYSLSRSHQCGVSYRYDNRPTQCLKPVHRVSIALYLEETRKVSWTQTDRRRVGRNYNWDWLSSHKGLSTLVPPKQATFSDRRLQINSGRIPVSWNKEEAFFGKGLTVLALTDPDDGKSKLVLNVGDYLPSVMASYLWRLESSSSFLWETKISQIR